MLTSLKKGQGMVCHMLTIAYRGRRVGQPILDNCLTIADRCGRGGLNPPPPNMADIIYEKSLANLWCQKDKVLTAGRHSSSKLSIYWFQTQNTKKKRVVFCSLGFSSLWTESFVPVEFMMTCLGPCWVGPQQICGAGEIFRILPV